MTPHYETKIRVELCGRGRWITLEPVVYVSAIIGRLEIPAEFVTDFASVPRVPFAYMITGGRAPQAAIPHDYGYQRQLGIERATWDAVFREAMGVQQPELGIEAEPEYIRTLMWSGVRAGGWQAWNGHQERKEDLNPIWTATSWPAPEAA